MNIHGSKIDAGPALRIRVRGQNPQRRRRQRFCYAGYSLIELMLVMAISMVMGAMVIPSIRSTMANYQLSAAVDSASGAIQTTRYQAIMQGYPYQVAFSATNNTFQVLSQAPPATSFSNVGSTVPLAGIPIVVSANTTLQFKANGAVTAPVGGMSFTISYQGKTKTMTVSKYGSITVQ